MKIFQILVAGIFCLLGASSAYAGGDLTDYKPYAPAPVASSCGGPFSGFYAGGLIGFGGASTKTNVGIELKDNDRGFTGGGVAGYNWQCNGWLLGAETDINYFNADMTTGISCPACGANDGPSSLTFGSEINWYGTVRGRVGLVGTENFLLFATGGLAYGGLDHSINSINAPTGTPGGSVTYSGSKSNTALGWTAGGGVEYLLNDNWAFRADAMYVDFGSNDETFTAPSGSGCEGTCTARVGYDDSFWVARVGLTYLFGAPAAAPGPDYAPIK